MEKIIVNPTKIRGLGNIINTKTTSDYGEYNSNLTSSTNTTYGTVYNSSYLAGSYITLTYEKILTEPGDLTVTCNLRKTSDDSNLSNATVKCYYNNTTYTATTANGQCTFTLPIGLEGIHTFKVIYEGATVAGSIKTGQVYCGDFSDLELFFTENPCQLEDTIGLVGRTTPEVPGVTVSFYSSWEAAASLTLTTNRTALGPYYLEFKARVIDATTQAPVHTSGNTVNFYQIFTPGAKLNIENRIGKGDTTTLKVNLIDTVDGNHVHLANQSVSFYIEE